MASKKALDGVRNNLEGAFFLERDSVLIDNLKKMRRMEKTKERLSEVSGISNDAVLQKLVDLEVRPETLATLSMVPLVEVAWADGKIDEKEKEAVKKAVEQVLPDNAVIDLALVERWLQVKPPENMLTAWIHYIEGLREALSESERADLKECLIGQARAVAEASGGILGLTSKISAPEQAMLDKMSAAFGD